MTLKQNDNSSQPPNDLHPTAMSSKKLSKSKDSIAEDPNLTSCGLGSWRPAWLQMFANPVALLVNISFVCVVQGMAGSMIYSSINTLEKRYSFDSKISAIILTADSISGMILNPLVGYYAVRFNRSRLIGLAEIVLAFSCLLSSSPYFIYGPASHLIHDESLLSGIGKNKTNFEMCSAYHETSCDENQKSSGNTVWPAVVILFVANFLRGLGLTTFYVIAMPFMDDNVSKKNSPIYISVMQTILLIGPAIGFFYSAYILSLYEDPWNDPGLARTDPRFVGAWWLGFLTVGILLLIAAMPMLFFPAQFKNAFVKATVIKKKMKESGGTIEAIKRFLRNPLIIIYFLGNVTRYFGIGGYYMFNTKYIESQYRQSSSSASLISGTASIAPISIGIILGGLFITIYKPRARVLFTFVFLAEFAAVFTIGSGLIFGCDPIKLNGSQVNDGGGFSLGSTCNQNCDCSTRVYTPICGPDSVTTYFSPCHAGCKSYNGIDSTFQDCSCFTGPATKGYCPGDLNCKHLPIYMAMIIVGAIISSSAKTGNQLITFRTVEPMDKSFTNGFCGLLISIFTLIPFPIVFGHIADSSCLVWERKCGKRGNCWLYDQVKFCNRLHTVTIIFMTLGSVFDFLLIFFADRIDNLYGEKDENEEENDGIDNLNEMKTIQKS